MLRIYNENLGDEHLENLMDIFSGQFWTNKNEMIDSIEKADGDFHVDEFNDEYMIISDDDGCEFQVTLIMANNTIAVSDYKILQAGDRDLVEEDIDDDYEYSISKYANYLMRTVNEYLQDNYSEEDIIKFDAYIDSLLSDNDISIKELVGWDIDWVKNIMKEALRMKTESVMTYRIPLKFVEDIIETDKFYNRLKEDYGGNCMQASCDCSQAVNMTSKTCLARPVPTTTVYIDDEEDDKEKKVSPRDNILLDINGCIFDLTNKKYKKKKKKPYTELENYQDDQYDKSMKQQATLKQITDNYINLYNVIRDIYMSRMQPKTEGLIPVFEDLELSDYGITGDWAIEIGIRDRKYFYVSKGELSIDEIYRRFEKMSKFSQGKALNYVLKKYCRLATDEDMEIINLRNELENPNIDDEEFHEIIDRLKELGAE